MFDINKRMEIIELCSVLKCAVYTKITIVCILAIICRVFYIHITFQIKQVFCFFDLRIHKLESLLVILCYELVTHSQWSLDLVIIA